MRWTFDGYLVDEKRAEIVGPEGLVHVERLPFRLLVHLISNSERVIAREELIDAIWGGRFVSEATISTAIKQARKAVGDDGSKQAAIKTVHGLGYRFVADLEEIPPAMRADIAKSEGSNQLSRPPSDSATPQPGLTVVKFQMARMHESMEWLASALPSELLSTLSRLRWLQVISRGSSFQFDPGTLDPVDVGAKLGVRYILTGSIEASAQEILIRVELLAARDGCIIWSATFKTDLRDIKTARHRIVSSIVGALEFELPRYEANQSHRLTDHELDAWSHFHIGLSQLY